MHGAGRRVAMGALALGLAAGTLGVWASPADALAPPETSCTGQPTHNVCLTITPWGSSGYIVRLGVDIHMTPSEAQRFFAQGDGTLTVTLWGDDHFDDDFLATIPLAAWGVSGGTLGGDFEIALPRSVLDEDAPVFGDAGGGDEVFARVQLFDRTHRTNSFYFSHTHKRTY